jgi:hypothetical protein
MTLQSVQLHLRSPLETAARRSSLAGGRTFYKHRIPRPNAHEVKGVTQNGVRLRLAASGNCAGDARLLEKIPHPYKRRVQDPRKASGRSQTSRARPELHNDGTSPIGTRDPFGASIRSRRGREFYKLAGLGNADTASSRTG